MISSVTGTVASISAGCLVLDTGAFGVELVATARCLARAELGRRCTVPAQLVVREDSLTLYGFADADERACFAALQQAKGVGPKVAVALLGVLTPDQLRRAVAEGDTAALTAAPGVGARGAARLVIDLRDRLGPPLGAEPAPVPAQGSGWQAQIQAALVGLGWTAGDAAGAVARVAAELPEGGEVPDHGALLRLALRSLDRGAARDVG